MHVLVFREKGLELRRCGKRPISYLETGTGVKQSCTGPLSLTTYFITDVWRTPQMLKLTPHTRPQHHKIYNMNRNFPPLPQMLPGWIRTNRAPKSHFPSPWRSNVETPHTVSPGATVKRTSPRHGNNIEKQTFFPSPSFHSDKSPQTSKHARASEDVCQKNSTITFKKY